MGQQSVRRKIKRGGLRMIWNVTFSRMDFFKKASNGRFILASPIGRFIAQGPGHHAKTLNKWQAN